MPRELTTEERQRKSEHLSDIGRGGHRNMPFGSLLNEYPKPDMAFHPVCVEAVLVDRPVWPHDPGRATQGNAP